MSPVEPVVAGLFSHIQFGKCFLFSAIAHSVTHIELAVTGCIFPLKTILKCFLFLAIAHSVPGRAGGCGFIFSYTIW